jgi:hypothetical protein
MAVIKLNESHADILKKSFEHDKFMGNSISPQENNLYYLRFCQRFLFNLNSFHSYGYVENDEVKSLVGYYESDEEPAWYYLMGRSNGDQALLQKVLDKVLEVNENNGRCKFYSLVNCNHSKLLRKLYWSKYNSERYDFYDECFIPAKHKSIYTNHWELLFNRTLMEYDTVIRCNFLKQEYRNPIPLGGNL